MNAHHQEQKENLLLADSKVCVPLHPLPRVPEVTAITTVITASPLRPPGPPWSIVLTMALTEHEPTAGHSCIQSSWLANASRVKPCQLEKTGFSQKLVRITLLSPNQLPLHVDERQLHLPYASQHLLSIQRGGEEKERAASP